MRGHPPTCGLKDSTTHSLAVPSPPESPARLDIHATAAGAGQDSVPPEATVPGAGEPLGLSSGADGSLAAPHSEWAAADVPAGDAERDGADTAAFASAPDHPAPGSGWQHQADEGSEQSAAGHEANFSGAAAGYGDAWNASRGGGDPVAMPWQPPPEPRLPDDTGTTVQAPSAHGEIPAADAAQAPYSGISFGGGGYGSSPLQLSPPSMPEPAATYGAEAGTSVSEWQPGVGPGTGSAAAVEDEMVELDF